MDLNKLKKDSSGIATILLVIILVVVIAGAGAAAYVVLSNNGGNEDNTPKEMPIVEGLAPGTVIKIDFFDGTQTIATEAHYLGQNAEAWFVKSVWTYASGAKYEGYSMMSKAAFAGANSGPKKYIGTEERQTFEGKKTLQVWEYTVNGVKVKTYINPANGLDYYTEYYKSTATETYTLKYYDLKKQTSFTPSNSIGKTYEYAGIDQDDNEYTAKLKCVADCTGGKFGVELSGSFSTYFYSNYMQGLPTTAVKTETVTLNFTLDGAVTVEKWKYEIQSGYMMFYVNPTTHVIHAFAIYFDDGDAILFELTKKP